MVQSPKPTKRKLGSISLQNLIVGTTFFIVWIFACSHVSWNLASGLRYQGFGFPFPMFVIESSFSDVQYHWSVVGLLIDGSFGLFLTIQALWGWNWISKKAAWLFRPSNRLAVSNNRPNGPAENELESNQD